VPPFIPSIPGVVRYTHTPRSYCAPLTLPNPVCAIHTLHSRFGVVQSQPPFIVCPTAPNLTIPPSVSPPIPGVVWYSHNPHLQLARPHPPSPGMPFHTLHSQSGMVHSQPPFTVRYGTLTTPIHSAVWYTHNPHSQCGMVRSQPPFTVWYGTLTTPFTVWYGTLTTPTHSVAWYTHNPIHSVVWYTHNPYSQFGMVRSHPLFAVAPLSLPSRSWAPLTKPLSRSLDMPAGTVLSQGLRKPLSF
jgi:hypothetical protein